jgi:hypothetical protein
LLPRLDVDVGNATGLRVWDWFVVTWVGVFGDDVPGVEKAGDEAEHAEEDVDE